MNVDEAESSPSGFRIDSSDRQIIQTSARFDADFYHRTYRGSIPAGQSAVDHFLASGCERGFLASADFDPIVYRLRHLQSGHPNPLVDAIRNGDRENYRNISALFWDIDVSAIRQDIDVQPMLEEQWTAHAAVIVQNVDRSVRLPGRDGSYQLRNPTPQNVLARLADNRPFSFARLTHGCWDTLYVIDTLAARLRQDPRCATLTKEQVKSAAVRLFAREFIERGKDFSIENMCREFEADMADNPTDADFWTGISLRGIPTFDDGAYGLDRDQVRERLDLIGRFFGSGDLLYDAMMWKRWALSGDLARFAGEVRAHPVIVIGPEKFHSLGDKWALSRFRHIAIGSLFSHLIRYALLDETVAAVDALVAEGHGPKPIVLLQCGSLAYWLIRRLRPQRPDVFYLDLGQALDLWYWDSGAPWMRIYRDALLQANPFAAQAGAAAAASPTVAASTGPSARATAKIEETLRRDYLDTGFMTLPPSRPLCSVEGDFRRRGERGWSAELPAALAALSDDSQGPRQSRLVLLEDGKPLGVGHDSHEEIFERGAGRYSFWRGTLYFSTPDGTDPNRSGRRYTVATLDLNHSDEAPGSTASTAAALLTLKGGFRPVQGFGWQAELPGEFEPLTDGPSAHEHSPLVLLEDRQTLGPAHARHDDIRAAGRGAYSFWRGSLYFSASDNSDPNRNGRTYAVAKSAGSGVDAAESREARVAAALLPVFGSATQGAIAAFTGLMDRGGQGPSPFRDLRRKFVIGFVARTGSTLLCQNLYRYGVAVAEYFNPTHIRSARYDKGGGDFRALCSRLVETYAVDGAWGVKVHIGEVIPFFLVEEFPERLRDWRFVYVTRENIVRQAISMVIARKSRSWASWEPASHDVALADYSRDEIARCVHDVTEAQARWEKFLEMFDIEPLRLTYEQIVADAVGTADLTAEFCGLAPNGAELVEQLREPDVLSQTRPINAAWEERFRRESR